MSNKQSKLIIQASKKLILEKKHSALHPKQPKNWYQDIAQLGMYTTFLLSISGLEFPEINSQYLIHTIIDQMCLGIPK